MLNSYWHLRSKDKNVNSEFIVELKPDGMAYVWPVFPGKQRARLSLDEDQDLETLFVDGDYLAVSGFFYGIADFMDHSNYSPALYDYLPIGEFISIRACRGKIDAVCFHNNLTL